MEAYEFFATPENGVITIPEQYRRRITSGVKVILLAQKPNSDGQRRAKPAHKSDMLLIPTLTTNGWKFNREAANER